MRLELSDISAGYDSAPILTDISCAVSDGEFVGLVGPNGSGKSTLVRVMSRVLPPRAGRVSLDGADLYHLSALDAARRIAVVPQDSAYQFDFTVLEVVLMGRSPHLGRFALEGTADYAIAERALRLTGTAHLAARPVTATSGGERQRVAVARALAQEPQLLLLDEPTAYLDINHQIEVLDLVRGLNRDHGMAVVVVMHDLNLAAQYCDRMVLLHHGRMLAQGPPREVITAQRVRQAYGAEVTVKIHPVTGRPYFTLLSRLPVESPRDGMPVHVICGAGTGAGLMERLTDLGYRVSAGVLNVEDSDQQTAERLGLPRAEEAPFSGISDEAREENRRLMAAAEVVILAPIPVGPGNLANLEAALTAARSGQRVIVINSPPVEARDFTSGQAPAMYGQLAETGAELVYTPEEALARLADRDAPPPAAGAS